MTLSYDAGGPAIYLTIGGTELAIGGVALAFGKGDWDGRRQQSLLPDPTDYELTLSETIASAFAALPDPWTIPDVLSWERCPAALLPWLAWEWSVDEWQRDWPIAMQRDVIAASWGLHSIKGSAGAMQRAVGALGYAVDLVEWWQVEPERDPYTYRYKLTSPFGRPWSDAEIASMERISLRAKNIRSWLDAIEINVSGAKAPVYSGAAILSRVRVAPETDPVTQLDASAAVFAGVAAFVRVRVVISVS